MGRFCVFSIGLIYSLNSAGQMIFVYVLSVTFVVFKFLNCVYAKQQW